MSTIPGLRSRSGRGLFALLVCVSVLATGCVSLAIGGGGAGGGAVSSQAERDAAITRSIQGALAADPAIRTTYLSVSTRNGVVSLTGSVQSAHARTEAERVAAGTSGVSAVRNELKVIVEP